MFLLIMIVLGGSILVGWLVPMAFKSERPYGLVGDILVPTIVGIGYTYLIYGFVAPMVGLGGWLAFWGSAIEGIAVAAITLWILRRIKK